MRVNNIKKGNFLGQITKIFIRYFAFFFLILLAVVSFGQYKDQGEINLIVCLTFSFPIACLGAAIAAVFIGGFKKLDAAPSWVQPSEYVTVEKSVLNRELSRIRRKRILIFAMLAIWLPFGVFILAINLPIFLFAYMAALAVVYHLLYFSKCPRCNNYFFYRYRSKGSIVDTLNLLFGGGYHKTFSSRCLNCGLNLRNENSI
jgi:hypothetical protein